MMLTVYFDGVSARILTGKEPVDSEERGVRPEVSSRPDPGLDISIASEDVSAGIVSTT